MGRKKITMKHWIFKIIVAGFAVMAAMFLAVPWYAGAKMQKQAMKSNEKMTGMYLKFLDSSVDGINKLLSQFATSTYDISVLAMTEDKLERYEAKMNVMQKLKDASAIYNVFDGIFVYSQSAFEDAFLCQVGQGGNGTQVTDMKVIMKHFEANYSFNNWELVHYGNRDYLMRVVKTGSTSCGAWIDAASLIRPLKSNDNKELGTVLFLNREGRIISSSERELSGNPVLSEENNGHVIKVQEKRYLQTMEDSRYLPVSMAILIPEEQYMRDIYFVQNVMGLLLALGLLIFPVLGKLLSRNISVPVEQLIASMSEVQKGNLEVRVKPEGKFFEFDQMGRYFNNMISEIQRLQKDVYERKISEQKIQLQYLQTQIRPHFFLNTLNAIYSFSLVKRNDLIEKMVVCLSKYFGYRFKSTDAFVTLGEEKEHIENYLELHQLRYQDQFFCQIEIEEVLLDAKLPPLIIQTFVENSLKYGFLKDRVFEVEIIAEVLKVEDTQMLKITITDNGPGYEPEVLDEAAETGKVTYSHGQGIGINNVMQRLELIYHGEARIKLSNIPGGGACSEIMIPLAFAEEEEMEV